MPKICGAQVLVRPGNSPVAPEETGPLRGGRGCEGWTGCLYWWLSAHAYLWNCPVGRYRSLLRKETPWLCSSAHIGANCQKSLHQRISEIKTNAAIFILATDHTAFLLCVSIPICANNLVREWSTSTSTGGVKTGDSTAVFFIISFCYGFSQLSVLATSVQ